jgi:hypothetical protein
MGSQYACCRLLRATRVSLGRALFKLSMLPVGTDGIVKSIRVRKPHIGAVYRGDRNDGGWGDPGERLSSLSWSAGPQGNSLCTPKCTAGLYLDRSVGMRRRMASAGGWCESLCRFRTFAQLPARLAACASAARKLSLPGCSPGCRVE